MGMGSNKKDTIKIACLGDSVTQGVFEVGESENGEFLLTFDQEAVYHNRLKKLMEAFFPEGRIEIINAGISGDSAVSGLKRLEESVISKEPDFCILCFGLNDAASGSGGLAAYKNAMETMIRRMKEKGISVILLTPCMMNKTVSDKITTERLRQASENCAKIQREGTMDRYMETVRELAETYQVPLCDEYAVYQQWSRMGADTDELLSNYINHPVREIHLLWAADLFHLIANSVICSNWKSTLS